MRPLDSSIFWGFLDGPESSQPKSVYSDFHEPDGRNFGDGAWNYPLLCLVISPIATEYFFNLLFSGDSAAEGRFFCICIAWPGDQWHINFNAACRGWREYALAGHADYGTVGYVLCCQQNPYVYKEAARYDGQKMMQENSLLPESGQVNPKGAGFPECKLPFLSPVSRQKRGQRSYQGYIEYVCEHFEGKE